jgi:peptidoglycan hydrolase-like protein with peptidoglycan-binding domain
VLDRPGRSRSSHLIEDEAVLGDGAVGRLADRVLENPAMSGGLFVMALTAAAIVSNGLFLQTSRHPDPLFMTRPASALPLQAAAPVPLPRARIEAPDSVPPLPRQPPAAAEPAPSPDAGIVASVQRALSAKGLYRGAVDGIAGSRTRAAISAFEKARGLSVTGAATSELLDRIKTASLKPVAVTTPVKPPAHAPTAVPAAKPLLPSAPAAVQASPTEKPAALAAIPPVMTPVPVAAPSTPAIAAAPDPAGIERQQYQGVQNALNQIGYGPVPADGEQNDETAGAIRRFELDNGLPITGKLGDRLVSRLVAIGAMKRL